MNFTTPAISSETTPSDCPYSSHRGLKTTGLHLGVIELHQEWLNSFTGLCVLQEGECLFRSSYDSDFDAVEIANWQHTFLHKCNQIGVLRFDITLSSGLYAIQNMTVSRLAASYTLGTKSRLKNGG